MKMVVFCLSMIASFSSYTQSKVKVGLKMNLGPYGLSNNDIDQDVDTYFNIGLTTQVLVSEEEKFSIGIDFLYNSSAFSHKADIYTPLSTFSIKNVLIPLKVNYHSKEWTFSAGLINSIVIDAKLQNDEYQVKDGDLYTFNQEEIKLAFLNKNYDLQGILGARYAVGSRIHLGLETTFYFAENDFYFRRYPNYSFSVKNLNYGSISCSAIYFMN